MTFLFYFDRMSLTLAGHNRIVTYPVVAKAVLNAFS